MRTRIEPLTASTKPGNFVIEVDKKGPHNFRLPPPSQCERIADYWRERGTGDSARIYEQAGIVIGLAWRHEVLEFEAVYPAANPTTEALAAYSEAIQSELTEEGYDVIDIGVMGRAITQRINARATEAVEARKLAGFTEPPKAS